MVQSFQLVQFLNVFIGNFATTNCYCNTKVLGSIKQIIDGNYVVEDDGKRDYVVKDDFHQIETTVDWVKHQL